jgi:hypothetical protein
MRSWASRATAPSRARGTSKRVKRSKGNNDQRSSTWLLGKGVGALNRCTGHKKDGTPCTLTARGNSAYCWAHDPSNAEQRTRNATKAGRVKTVNGQIVEIKAQLKELMDGVVEGKKDKARVSVAAQVAGVLVRYYELERRIKVDEDLEKRIEELEAVAESRQGGGSSYGFGR